MRMIPRTWSFVILSALAAAQGGCDPRRAVMGEVMGQLSHYFTDPEAKGPWSIDRVADGVYTFRWTWYRNIAVETADGWFVADPFNREAARTLVGVLREIRPDLPVHTLFYTHYHLDHVRGGAALAPENVVAHRKCMEYWKDLGGAAADVLAPTRWVDGDETLAVGGVEIRLLYLGDSHSDTIYAVHLPDSRVLFTADLGLVRAIPPVGVPDRYGPGYLKALERVAAIDFDVFVPSHFGFGRKQDLVDSLGYFRAIDRLARASLARSGGDLETEPAAIKRTFFANYDALKKDYGDWHGFDEMILMNITRAMTGALLGY